MTLRLESVHNFRDVAGMGYAVSGGGTMATGVVYRSSVLSVADDEMAAWEGLGVTRVVDLRTEKEITRQPDILPAGADHVAVDVLAGNASAATIETSLGLTADRAREEMRRTYEAFVRGEAERRAFGEVVRAVAAADGPVVVHCTAGKDRTGWVSAVFQLLAGASEEDVLTDYLLTNELSADFFATIRSMVASEMPEQVDAVDALLVVEEAYLRTALEAMRADFDDVERYLVDGAGVERATVDRLRARLRA